jgi:hypothetical protein
MGGHYWGQPGPSEIDRCGTSSCDAGAAAVVANAQDITSLALFEGTFYWTLAGSSPNGAILSCPLAGCPNGTTIASYLNAPNAIAAASTGLYFVAADFSVSRVPLDGGSPSTIAPTAHATRLAVDGTHVYWSDAAGTIVRAAPDGSNQVTLASRLSVPGAIAIDDLFVYWVNSGDPGSSNGTVMRVAK